MSDPAPHRFRITRRHLLWFLAAWSLCTGLLFTLMPITDEPVPMVISLSSPLPQKFTYTSETKQRKFVYYRTLHLVTQPEAREEITYDSGGIALNIGYSALYVLGFFSTLTLLFGYGRWIGRRLLKVQFSLQLLFCWTLLTAALLGIFMSASNATPRYSGINLKPDLMAHFKMLDSGWPLVALTQVTRTEIGYDDGEEVYIPKDRDISQRMGGHVHRTEISNEFHPLGIAVNLAVCCVLAGVGCVLRSLFFRHSILFRFWLPVAKND